MTKPISLSVVVVFYCRRHRRWAIKAEDGRVVHMDTARRHTPLFDLAHAALASHAHARVAEVMVEGQLRLAWSSENLYQWLDSPNLPGPAWKVARGAVA